ncbi:hypothetical protein DFJ74DRAFT_655832 [Hyaloraphidium curvatum]|nr:hypothetical protein DFJ74DRAFT_655832 [Hyaloraphidium curvatum]
MPPPKLNEPFPALPELTYIRGAPPAPGGPLLCEAWATWCAPCKANIPHLEALHRKYPDLRIVAVAVREAGEPDEIQERVEKFVASKGDGMTYPVAVDAPPAEGGVEGLFADAFLAAGKARLGLPMCFLVGADGRTAFVGKPEHVDIDGRVGKVVDGTYVIPGSK